MDEQTIPQTATTSQSSNSKPKGAKSMLGFASTFRETKTTEEWMKEYNLKNNNVLSFYGFELIDYIQVIPQRYMLKFKLR